MFMIKRENVDQYPEFNASGKHKTVMHSNIFVTKYQNVSLNLQFSFHKCLQPDLNIISTVLNFLIKCN